jgi:GWxTD domain-containing protein
MQPSDRSQPEDAMRAWSWLWCAAIVLAVGGRVVTAQTVGPAGIDRLRADAEAYPDSFPLVFAYGQALARAVSERASEWRARLEARKVLERAFRLRPDDPRPFFELGALMRKQGFRPDALRVLERAEDRAATATTAMTAAERAEMHYQMALIHEVWWEDNENLGLLPGAFTTLSCSRLLQNVSLEGAGWREPRSSLRSNLLLYNVACPPVFDEVMQYWAVPDGQGEVDRQKMLHHFRAAVEADPSDSRAALRLMRHLAAANAWDEYLAVAAPLATRLADDPDVLLFLGLGFHATSQAERADSAFALAMRHASDTLLRDMLEPGQLMRPPDSTAFDALPKARRDALTDIFWRSRDPLFLTVENERLAEHLARLAYVEIAYSSPQSGLRGRWSDRGAAWLRWGRPLQIRSIRPGDGPIIEFWDYGAGSPDLVFQRMPSYRRGRLDELTAEYVRYARERVPELYAGEHPRLVGTIPFQAAAFRDATGGAVLEVYAQLPGDKLRAAADIAELESGIFVMTGDEWETRAARRQTLANRGEPTRLGAAFPVAAGSYVVSVEAVASDIAARHRERVDVPAFGDSLALSDLLLVERFGADTSMVDDRAALAPVVSPTRVFPSGAPVGVVWEIYGLRPDPSGIVRYAVRVAVTDADRDDAPVQLEAGGGNQQGMAWSASRVPRADGAVVEFVTFDLPKSRPGSYRLFITVTDEVTGRSFAAHRAFAIGESR